MYRLLRYNITESYVSLTISVNLLTFHMSKYQIFVFFNIFTLRPIFIFIILSNFNQLI